MKLSIHYIHTKKKKKNTSHLITKQLVYTLAANTWTEI